jgi:uncharacterized protein YqeY
MPRFVKANAEEYYMQCEAVVKVLEEYLGHDLEEETLNEMAQEAVNAVYLAVQACYGDRAIGPTEKE